MQSKDVVIIKKIINYINEVGTYVDGMSSDEFLEDKKTMSACAFSVSQIGELAKLVSEETQAKYNDIPWTAIKGMRNRIVHDYENVNLMVLWATIEKSLPELKINLEKVVLDLN